MAFSVSVVVPVYNSAKYLKSCVESILRQTFQDYELILVDDGSFDGSEGLCDRYAAEYDHIKVIHKENAGLGYARNSGIDAAAGRYVAFVDSDDCLGPELLLHLYEAAERNCADYAVAGCTVIYPNGKEQVRRCVERDRVFRGEEVQELLLGSFGALPGSRQDVPYGQAVWARMYSRQVLAEHNIRFVSEREQIAEDLVFNLDFLRWAKCAAAIPDVSYFYNCTNAGSLSKAHRSDRARMDIQMKKYMEEKLDGIFEHKEYRLYLQRSLITRVAYDIVQEVLYHDRKDKTYPLRKAVKDILAEEELRKVLCEYPWWKLSFQRMILTGMMRFQLVNLLILSIRVREYFVRSM